MQPEPNKSGEKRPYLKHSVAQLEALFEQGRQDQKLLSALERELRFRSTERATRLRRQVAAALKVEALNASAKQASNRDQAEKSRKSEPIRPTQSKPIAAAPQLDPSKFPAPKSDNEPGAILAAWTALEALSPQTYRRPDDLSGGDRGCVAAITGERMPWETGERSRPNKQLYYQVMLGAIPMGAATDRLVSAFGEDEERGTRSADKATIGAVLVDRKGIPVAEKGIAVSSFGWALPIALKGDLAGLGAWPTIEPAIIDGLGEVVRRKDKQDQPLPLDAATIADAHRWLVAKFNLSDELVEPPSFALRVFHYYRAKNPPDVALLNSFFLNDLSRTADLVRHNKAPAALRRYLGLDTPPETFDLLADRPALEQAVAPLRMPAARWPSPGGHALVLLQQAAVNLARAELAGKEGLIAVNGPPGTGKTTLLRDIVASCVLDRALAMAAFDDPEKAFTPSGQKVSVGERAFLHLYTLDASLKGHEVLVASSNNKAVENISRELPGLKAVGRSTDELSYFRSVSDHVHASKATADADEGDASAETEAVETWGMIAAVLGNRANLAAFQQGFWWHEDRGFRHYLKAAKGDSTVIEIKHPQTGAVVERRTPAIIALEQPPPPEMAKANWCRARQRLLTLKREIDAELAGLESVRRSCLDLAETWRDMAEGEKARAATLTQRATASQQKQSWENRLQAVRQGQAGEIAAIAAHRRTKPWFVLAVLRTQRWKEWSQVQAPLLQASSAALAAVQTAEQNLTRIAKTLESIGATIAAIESRLRDGQQKAARLSKEVEGHRQLLGDRLIDEQFFGRTHEEIHLAAPWVPDSLHRKREELFAAALDTHRAFIDASARRIYHNLGYLMDTLSNGAPVDDTKRKLMGDLWSTLFLTVPVVSTTFASVDRMLGALPPGSIGWLLIDEAGQALPQAAVGAVTRAKRTVVVGDPLQIPPVVTLPQRLNAQICKHFRVDPARWAAPDASAQTLADRASRFQGEFRSPDGARRVGIPLLTHRRCQEPMFGIFNRVAYDGQMVQATPPKQGEIGAVLGPSQWLDVNGDAETKWCRAEGEAAVSLLRILAAAGVLKPDLFIVTPFRIVAQELRHRLEQERSLFAALGVDARQWPRDRVGTIHTVQGREADAVILILGAPKPNQAAARAWAAGMPNIFNVAVSRARQNLYVIGSRGAWAGVGNARELAALPVNGVEPRLGEPGSQDLCASRDPSDAEISKPQQRHGPTLA